MFDQHKNTHLSRQFFRFSIPFLGEERGVFVAALLNVLSSIPATEDALDSMINTLTTEQFHNALKPQLKRLLPKTKTNIHTFLTGTDNNVSIINYAQQYAALKKDNSKTNGLITGFLIAQVNKDSQNLQKKEHALRRIAAIMFISGSSPLLTEETTTSGTDQQPNAEELQKQYGHLKNLLTSGSQDLFNTVVQYQYFKEQVNDDQYWDTTPAGITETISNVFSSDSFSEGLKAYTKKFTEMMSNDTKGKFTKYFNERLVKLHESGGLKKANFKKEVQKTVQMFFLKRVQKAARVEQIHPHLQDTFVGAPDAMEFKAVHHKNDISEISSKRALLEKSLNEMLTDESELLYEIFKEGIPTHPTRYTNLPPMYLAAIRSKDPEGVQKFFEAVKATKKTIEKKVEGNFTSKQEAEKKAINELKELEKKLLKQQQELKNAESNRDKNLPVTFRQPQMLQQELSNLKKGTGNNLIPAALISLGTDYTALANTWNVSKQARVNAATALTHGDNAFLQAISKQIDQDKIDLEIENGENTKKLKKALETYNLNWEVLVTEEATGLSIENFEGIDRNMFSSAALWIARLFVDSPDEKYSKKIAQKSTSQDIVKDAYKKALALKMYAKVKEETHSHREKNPYPENDDSSSNSGHISDTLWTAMINHAEMIAEEAYKRSQAEQQGGTTGVLSALATQAIKGKKEELTNSINAKKNNANKRRNQGVETAQGAILKTQEKITQQQTAVKKATNARIKAQETVKQEDRKIRENQGMLEFKTSIDYYTWAHQGEKTSPEQLILMAKKAEIAGNTKSSLEVIKEEIDTKQKDVGLWKHRIEEYWEDSDDTTKAFLIGGVLFALYKGVKSDSTGIKGLSWAIASLGGAEVLTRTFLSSKGVIGGIDEAYSNNFDNLSKKITVPKLRAFAENEGSQKMINVSFFTQYIPVRDISVALDKMGNIEELSESQSSAMFDLIKQSLYKDLNPTQRNRLNQALDEKGLKNPREFNFYFAKLITSLGDGSITKGKKELTNNPTKLFGDLFWDKVTSPPPETQTPPVTQTTAQTTPPATQTPVEKTPLNHNDTSDSGFD